jgi:hypothetical protein
MEAQSSARDHERTRNPTWFKPENPSASFSFIANRRSIDHSCFLLAQVSKVLAESTIILKVAIGIESGDRDSREFRSEVGVAVA